MGFLSILGTLGPLKKIVLNKYVIIGALISGALIYHFFTVNGLEKDILILTNNNKVLTNNVIKITDSNTSNLATISKLQEEILEKEKEKEIINVSYIKEIDQYKALITNLNKKVKFKKVIRVNDCKIKIKTKDEINEEGKNYIFDRISTIGK